MQLILYKNKKFGEMNCDIYKQENEQNNFWMTRKQIGEALAYSDPKVAMSKLHNQHKDRLDKFSGVTRSVTPEGGTQKTFIYSAKGIYEVCRWSKQPKADAFMDWVYEVIEDIRNHGIYMTPETIERTLTDPDYIIQLATVLKHEKEARVKAEEDSNKKTIIIQKQQPLVDFAESIQVSKNDISVKDLAGVLSNQITKIGRNDLFKWLRNNKYLCAAYSNKNKPSQKSLDMKLMTYSEDTYETDYGNTYTTFTPKITSKGQLYFVTKFKKLKKENKLNGSIVK